MTSLFYSPSETTNKMAAKTRDEIRESYQWNLTDLYDSSDAWEADLNRLKSVIGDIVEYQGTLDQSANRLYSCLELTMSLYKTYLRLNSYASKLHDQDTRESEPQAMMHTISQVGTRLSSATSFIDPEILSIDEKTVRDFLETKPALKVYEHYLDNLQRQKEHTLSSAEEKVISEAGLVAGAPYDIYNIFKNAEMPRPTLTIDGEQVRLDDAAFTFYRADSDRETRKNVFTKFFSAYSDFERTFGTELASQVNRDVFYKNVRGYNSCLEQSLDGNNIPTSVYHNLVSSVNEHLEVLHRYLKLRRRMLGVDQLHYYDVYSPLVDQVELDYTVEEAQALILKALQPLGSDYIKVLDRAFSNRWIDFMPNQGKSSGAYSSGTAYEVHPYILMNFNGRYDDVSTLAHELGHTMHSYLSNQSQPFVNAQYPIFLAEVASTTNEALVVQYVLQTIDDPRQRLAILGNQLENFRGTLFRQTQFAEFELKIHETVENGEPLTGTRLSELYLDILKRYYGHEQGITLINDLYKIEWAYIPHFYYNFYVFQYSTSLCAATAVSEKILTDGEEMRDKYLNDFLGAGGSDYAIPILRRVGVDMTSSKPYELTFSKMNDTMDEIEKILVEIEQA